MAFNIETYFDRAGKLIKHHNLVEVLRATLAGYADEIKDEYDDNRDLVTILADNLGSGSVDGFQSLFQQINTLTLRDDAANLEADSKATIELLLSLKKYMEENNESVNATVLTTPFVPVAQATNYGNGGLYVSHLNVEEVPDERIKDEDVRISVIRDKHTGATAGSETWELVGDPDINGRSTFRTALNDLTNGNFEDWTDGMPDGWLISAGTGSTGNTSSLISQDLYGYRGSSLRIDAGGENLFILEQEKSLSVDQIYFFAVRLSGDVEAAGSTLSIIVSGDEGMEETLMTIDPVTLGAGWSTQTVWFVLPKDPDDTLTIQLVWEGQHILNPDNYILVDELFITRPKDFGHMQYVVLAGEHDWIRDDQWNITTARTSEGIIQRYFCDEYDFQLPSVTDGSETRADALAI